MSQFLVQEPLVRLPVAPPPAVAPRPATPQTGERRRPGRIENASPELIALMRKPSRTARLSVALYDAPNFVLATDHRRPPVTGRTMGHMAIAVAGCSAACAVAFKTMLVLWG